MKHPLDRHTIQILKRSDITEHPFNPRVMTPQAKRRLRSSLEKNGLLDVLTFNRRTGRLLSGHQRLKGLDATADSPDYEIPAMVVDCDESQEKAMLLAMNNETAQGEWDMSALGEFIKTIEPVHIEATGFDPASLHSLFGASVTGVFPEVAATIKATGQLFSDKHKKADEANYQAVNELYTSGEDRLTGQPVELTKRAEKIQAVDQSFMVSVVCPDIGVRDAFMRRLGIEPDGVGLQFVDVRDVVASLKD